MERITFKTLSSTLEQSDALYNSLEHFRQCIVQDKESITDAKSAIRMLKILEQADKKL